MITTNTVLILGAGSSTPYQYLSGFRMQAEIIQKMASKDKEYNRISDIYKYSPDDLLDFTRALKFAVAPSVDAFLETRDGREKMITIGKAAIATLLIQRENLDLLFDPGNFRWYDLLVQKLRHGIHKKESEQFKQNNLSIITFNYDRSLEYFLFNSIRNWYDLKSDEDKKQALDLFRSIDIIHVHGIVGQPDFLSKDGRAYHFEVGTEDFKKSVGQIKIVHEEHINSPQFTKARKLISKAETIGILGFGWGEANMERLQLIKILEKSQGKRLFGTTKGLTVNDRVKLNKALAQAKRVNHLIELQDWKILDLLQNKPVLGE